jgi:hypothetical protein
MEMIPYLRYQDPDLAEQLWPVYLRTGAVSAAHRHAKEQGMRLGLQTVSRMAYHHDWAGKREQQLRLQFDVHTHSPAMALAELLNEVQTQKVRIQEKLRENPESANLHRIYKHYVGKVLAIHKQLAQTQAVDKERLLLAALKTVGNFFLREGRKDSAQFLSDRLEQIAEEILKTWDY